MLIKTDDEKIILCPLMTGRNTAVVPCFETRCAWYIETPYGYGYCGIIRKHENDLGEE